jgi:hypothetical protein
MHQHTRRSAIEIIGGNDWNKSARTVRNSREHRRHNNRCTAFNGGDSIQHHMS